MHEVHKPDAEALEGRTVADIARERGKDGVDTFLDLTLEDDLDIEFALAQFNHVKAGARDTDRRPARADRARRRRRACRHAVRRRLPDLSARHLGARAPGDDAGAGDCGASPRSRPISSASRTAAASKPASPPTSRSSIPRPIGSTNRGERRYDLPGGAKRMVMPSRGVEYTVVNGAVTWEHGKLTGATGRQGAARVAPCPLDPIHLILRSARRARLEGWATRGSARFHPSRRGLRPLLRVRLLVQPERIVL